MPFISFFERKNSLQGFKSEMTKDLHFPLPAFHNISEKWVYIIEILTYIGQKISIFQEFPAFRRRQSTKKGLRKCSLPKERPTFSSSFPNIIAPVRKYIKVSK